MTVADFLSQCCRAPVARAGTFFFCVKCRKQTEPKSLAWFAAMDAMAEDEAMKDAKPTSIEQLRHDLNLSPQEPLPTDK